jgi:hypothetical protein
MNSEAIQKAAGNDLNAKAKAYAEKHNCDYRQAVYAIVRSDNELGQRYATGEESAKKYDGSPARRAMGELLAEPGRVMILAGAALDRLVRAKLVNKAGVGDPQEAYRGALRSCRDDYPNLARAAADGFLAPDDYQTLALLVPAVAKEVEEGHYTELDRMVRRYF